MAARRVVPAGIVGDAMRLEDVTPGAKITGIAGDAPVTVAATARIGGNALRLTYRAETGKLDELILYRDHEPRLDVVKRAAYDLTANAGAFKLAADRSGLNQAQAYVAGLSAGEAAAFSTWDVFLGAAWSTSAMEDGLGRDLDLRYIDMSLSESAWRDLGLAVAVANRSSRTDGADIA